MGNKDATLVEFVGEPKRDESKPIDDVINSTLDKVVRFLDRDVEDVIEYIDANNIPAHFITAGKRIDLHPAREYLLRMPRTMREVVSLKRMMDNEDDELDSFYD